MTADHACYLCDQPVSWGTPICPRCGSALEWEEDDPGDPLAYLMPPNGGHTPPRRGPGLRVYALAALAFGLVMTVLGLLPGGLGLYALFVGLLFVVGGALGLVARRPI